MKKIIKLNLLLVLIFAFASVVYAGKPADEEGNYFGNGYPSGPHYNLNIIFKKSMFTCPDQEYYLQCPDGQTLVKDCADCPDGALGTCTPTNIPIYGGVIFAPQEPGNDPVTILMESGKKGPKRNPGATSLEVTDWCTETIDGGPAAFRLPANDKGYAVYARITGDPKQNPQFDLTNPRFHYVMDENGNELWLLGFVTNSVYGPDGQVLSRYDSGKKGRKVRNATEITPFFWWMGSVCYFDATDYCSGGDCTTVEYCCLDVDGDGDYENCAFLSNVGVDPDLDGNFECPTTDQYWCCTDTDPDFPGYEHCDEFAYDPNNPLPCPDSNATLETGALANYVEASCKTYDDWTWIFNIADFVGFLFDVESDKTNTGSVVLKLRFYPLPLNTK
jgi:hypothetical protein